MKFLAITLLLFVQSSAFAVIKANPSHFSCQNLMAGDLLQREIARHLESQKTAETARVRIFPQGKLAKNFSNGPTLYFGPASDILNMFTVAPLSLEYHLVDVFNGVVKSKREVVLDIEAALSKIDPSAKVTMFRSGFLAYENQEQKEEQGQEQDCHESTSILTKQKLSSECLKPAMLILRWTSTYFGDQERRVFVHPTDFADPQHLDILDQSLGSKPLGALMVIDDYPHGTLDRYAQKMQPGGKIILERFSYRGVPSLVKLGKLGELTRLRAPEYTPQSEYTELFLIVH